MALPDRPSRDLRSYVETASDGMPSIVVRSDEQYIAALEAEVERLQAEVDRLLLFTPDERAQAEIERLRGEGTALSIEAGWLRAQIAAAHAELNDGGRAWAILNHALELDVDSSRATEPIKSTSVGRYCPNCTCPACGEERHLRSAALDEEIS